MHPNLKQLSHSSSTLLHGCPRRYELSKLAERKENGSEGDTHLDFGSAVGTGTQELLMSGNINRATFLMFQTWQRAIDGLVFACWGGRNG